MIPTEAKSYDASGIIPKVGEDLQSYIERARSDLDALERFNRDVREKRIGTISIKERFAERDVLSKLEHLLRAGGYEVLDHPPMREYGFPELIFPVIALNSKVYPIFFGESLNVNFCVEGNQRKMPLTFVDEGYLEKGLPLAELGTTRSIRTIAGLVKNYHFEEFVAYSTLSPREYVWGRYFSGGARFNDFSFFHLFRSFSRLVSHEYLRYEVENGTAEKFPLPLLVRINIDEFRDIAQQVESGRDIETIVQEKSAKKSKDSWRWQLIAELCGF